MNFNNFNFDKPIHFVVSDNICVELIGDEYWEYCHETKRESSILQFRKNQIIKNLSDRNVSIILKRSQKTYHYWAAK